MIIMLYLRITISKLRGLARSLLLKIIYECSLKLQRLFSRKIKPFIDRHNTV